MGGNTELFFTDYTKAQDPKKELTEQYTTLRTMFITGSWR
jgi:hypothetical protein